MIRADFTWTPGDLRVILDALVAGKISPAVDRSSAIVAQEAQAAAPVRSSELRESIHPEAAVDSGTQVVGCVVADSEHAAYVEFGTGIRGVASGDAGPEITYSPDWPGMEAQPYMRPALDIARGAVLEEFLQ